MSNKPKQRLSLEAIKKSTRLQRRLANKIVRIWSDEWRAWWREGGHGYTDKLDEAAEWYFQDALDISSHAGPEKKIIYEEV
jgi:hypothetical protein